MKRTTLAAIAVLATGLGAAVASGFGFEDRAAARGAFARLSGAEAAAHAQTMFARADLDRNGALDVDEYASLEVVQAELARLNGYVVIETSGGPRQIAVAFDAPASLGRGERTLIDAFARSKFYALSGGAELMNEAQYVGGQTVAFNDSDRNGDGALANGELQRFAARGANVPTAGV